MKFSERMGISEPRDSLQKGEIDKALRIRLWNIVRDHFIFGVDSYTSSWKSYDDTAFFYRRLWDEHFNEPFDSIPNTDGGIKSDFADRFERWEWWEVYDFIEFGGRLLSQISRGNYEGFVKRCNNVLEEEKAAYRWVDDSITPITSVEEIREIEQAQQVSSKFSGVQEHLKEALHKLSDREDPDYRNSIKESISAVESLLNELTGSSSSTLGQALGELDLELHGALNSALGSLYGYTSDEDGIRHFMLEKPDVEFADAKYMLVICSAFINFLKEKSSE